jgi:aquaporin Z
MEKAIRSYIAEFLGTFTLVFVGTAVATLTGFPESRQIGFVEISLAFGFTLMVMVWTIGPVSGCHINPAVTLPMALSGRLPWANVPGYVIAQCAGAVAASGALKFLLEGIPRYELASHGLGANGNPLNMSTASLFGFEFVMTALFLMTIFSVTRRDAPPGFAGLAIGGFLLVSHLLGAQLGDSSLNPARSLGPALFVGGKSLEILWIFVAAPLVGGVVGWGLFSVIHKDQAS